MIDENGRASVLEFNARMGDPECQSLMVRMNSDLFEYLLFAEAGKLDELPISSMEGPDFNLCSDDCKGIPIKIPKR